MEFGFVGLPLTAYVVSPDIIASSPYGGDSVPPLSYRAY
jgi:hypothetical protein